MLNLGQVKLFWKDIFYKIQLLIEYGNREIRNDRVLYLDIKENGNFCLQ